MDLYFQLYLISADPDDEDGCGCQQHALPGGLVFGTPRLELRQLPRRAVKLVQWAPGVRHSRPLEGIQ